VLGVQHDDTVGGNLTALLEQVRRPLLGAPPAIRVPALGPSGGGRAAVTYRHRPREFSSRCAVDHLMSAEWLKWGRGGSVRSVRRVACRAGRRRDSVPAGTDPTTPAASVTHHFSCGSSDLLGSAPQPGRPCSAGWRGRIWLSTERRTRSRPPGTSREHRDASMDFKHDEQMHRQEPYHLRPLPGCCSISNSHRSSCPACC